MACGQCGFPPDAVSDLWSVSSGAGLPSSHGCGDVRVPAYFLERSVSAPALVCVRPPIGWGPEAPQGIGYLGEARLRPAGK